MKIVSIDVILLRKELESSMTISRGGFSQRMHTIVRVNTDEGISGLGEGIGNATMVGRLLDGPIGELAIGEDPFRIEALRRKLMDSQVYFELKGSALCAASAIEMACWDIKGKALNVPVHELLGGLSHDRLRAYASDIYWEESIVSIGNYAEKLAAAGYTAVKAHFGYVDPVEDAKRVEAVRRAIGPDIDLMIDLNAGYNLPDARRAARLWDQYDLYWLEEPVAPEPVSALADVRAKAPMPIAAGENAFQIHGFRDLFEQRAVDIAMPDIGRVGGLQETRDICVLASAYGVEVSPHNFSSGILLAATIQLMASLPNVRLLEVDASENAVYDELLVEPLEFKDGMVTVPKSPGLGVHLPDEVVNRYAIAVREK